MTTVDGHGEIAVRLLEATNGRDAGLVDRITGVINAVYRTTESGLWHDGVVRTTASEVAELIAAGQIAVATRDGRIAGSIRIRDVADDASEFGLLVAAPEQRGTGVSRALLDFAERQGREHGRRALRFELLVPRRWRHPGREFLKSWYGRRGYRLIHTHTLDDAYPHLAPMLATPCDLSVYEKPLATVGHDRLQAA